MVDVRLHTDHDRGVLQGASRGEHGADTRYGREARIDYRHIIGSLVRKPGAFARYRFREQMYPTHTRSGLHTMRCAAGRESVPTWTTCAYCILPRRLWSVRSRGHCSRLLESRVRFDYAVVRQLSAPASPEIPTVELPDARWTSVCMTGCSREVRDDDGHA